MYKVLIYTFSVLLSVFALSGINFNNFFKKNYKNEAKVFIFIISLALGYLLGSFIIEFLNASRLL
ncbi:MAG: DUF1146 family protein [Bacilli bacterium]|nr:DUF1146 family protein [Bacilli bacterium]